MKDLDDVGLALAVAAGEGRVDGRGNAQLFGDTLGRTSRPGLRVQKKEEMT